MNSKTVLVTGASGFIGRRLLELAPEDWRITAVWNRSEDFPEFVGRIGKQAGARPPAAITPVRCDLSNASAVAKMAQQMGDSHDVIIALAANGDPVISESDPLGDLQATTVGSLNTFTTFAAKKLIYFSTGAVYEGLRGAISPASMIRPTLPYAISHYAAERYAEYATMQKKFDETVVLRFFGAYGPHEPERKIYSRLVRRFAFDRTPRMTIRGDGKNMIDAMFVDDAVEAVKKIVADVADPGERGFKLFDLPGGSPMTINELVVRVARTFGIDAPELTYEGKVSEDHDFTAGAEAFGERYNFLPNVSIEAGILHLRDWLLKSA